MPRTTLHAPRVSSVIANGALTASLMFMVPGLLQVGTDVVARSREPGFLLHHQHVGRIWLMSGMVGPFTGAASCVFAVIALLIPGHPRRRLVAAMVLATAAAVTLRILMTFSRIGVIGP